MADDPKSPPEAAGDKPADSTPAEPIKGEVSRTDSPGAGASAAPVGPPRTEPPAPKPANPEAAVTATTSETSSATGQPTAPSKPPAPPVPKPAPAAAKPAAPHVPPPPPPPAGPTDPPPPADKAMPGFVTSLQSKVADGVSKVSFYLGDWTIIVPVAKLLEVMRHLHDAADARFDYLSDLTATDWPPRKEGRFDV